MTAAVVTGTQVPAISPQTGAVSGGRSTLAPTGWLIAASVCALALALRLLGLVLGRATPARTQPSVPLPAPSAAPCPHHP